MDTKYPDITVELSEHDGNATLILGRVARALRRADVSENNIQKYRNEAMSGDYDHLLQVTMAWVNVE